MKNEMITGKSWRVGCHADDAVRGRVVLINTSADLNKFEKGDILIAKQTDVNYVPQMIDATAVITEGGGRYSHAATFSRENGIPCMIGADGIMSMLMDGAMIELNTQLKQVTIISLPEGG